MKKIRREICYHGTNEQAAQSILVTGFRPETWFARELGPAIRFGGLHVFDVLFFGEPGDDWQFIEWAPISPERIVQYRVFQKDSSQLT